MAPKPQRQKASTEARRWHRFRFDVPVRVVLRRKARYLEFPARGTGMSEGGIALYLEAPLRVGNQLQVEFTLPYAGLPVRVRAAVRNAAGNRYGVEFLAADGAEQREVGMFRRMLRTAAARLGE
jgi:hypothetical protein